MNVIRFLYFTLTIVEVAKSSTEADDGSVLTQRLFESKHILRGSGSNDEKETRKKDEETSVDQNPKHMLEAGTKRLLQLMSINDDCDGDDEEGDENNDEDEMPIEPSTSPAVTRSNPPSMSTEPTPSPSFLSTVTRSNPPSISTEPTPSPSFLPSATRSNPPSMSTEPTPSPSFLPTVTRSDPPSMYLSMYPSSTPSIARYEVKKLVASDGIDDDYFGSSCSMSNELIVIGTPWVDDEKGAAYLFHLDGTEVAKLTPDNPFLNYERLGNSVSIDEKVVVGSGFYVCHVFSRDGIYERTLEYDETLTCNDDGCDFGQGDATTHGNLIVTTGHQNYNYKILIYSAEDGQLLKTIDQGSDYIFDVDISEQFIVSTSLTGGGYKTHIYNNTSPDFPKIAEINQVEWQQGDRVAVAGDRIVIGDPWANNNDGLAYLYNTNGTFVNYLSRRDASGGYDSSGNYFGGTIAINDNKVIVGERSDDDQGENSGSALVYSAVTGEFIEKVLAPDGEAYNYFGRSVCASGSSFVVGATGDDDNTGAAYLFYLP